MALLLSRIEAACLSSQHRKQINDLKKHTTAHAQPLPRERFSPWPKSGHLGDVVIGEIFRCSGISYCRRSKRAVFRTMSAID
jgi:surface antigen